ncbi:MAG: PAS domain S-box protein [Desulfobacteraceae bacterium]|nr:MAG: PAS domain S-box protein [Desulfobacteraceae bacterium]
MSVALFGATVFFLILPRMEDSIMAEKREMTRELVQTIVELLKTYQEDVDNGIIDLDTARKRALKRIQNVRYGSEIKDYFWINDLAPRMIMHPYRSDLNGQDIANFTDINGKKIFVEIVQEAGKPGGGFVEYSWQHQDDLNRIIPKISYVTLFKPWGWVIGSGLYYDDVEIEIAKLTKMLTVVGLGVFILAAFLSGYLAWIGLAATNEKQLVMEALQHSEAKFRGISSSANDGIIMINPEGLVSFWNKAAEQIFGYHADEILGKDLHRLLAPADQYSKYSAVISRFPKDGVGVVVGNTLELNALHKDRKEIPIELSVSALNFDDEWHAVGIVRDISEKKKAILDLQESETKYRTLFDSTNDIILLMENNGIVDCNARALDLFHADRPAISGKTIVDFSPEFQSHGLLSRTAGSRYINLAADNKPQHFEWTYQSHEGELVYTDVVLKKINLLGRDLLMAVCRDITDYKKRAAEKEQAASLFNTAIEQSPAGIMIADAANGNLLHVNQAALEMLGETKKILDADYSQRLQPAWRILDSNGQVVNPEDQPLRKAFTQGVVTSNKTFVIEKSDKTRIWIEVNACPVLDNNGRILFGVVVFTDINQRIQAEEAMYSLNQFQESIIDNAMVWLSVNDETGNVILWNKAAEEISGYNRKHVVGNNIIWKWAYPDETYRNRIGQKFAEVTRTGISIQNEETTIQCRDGKTKTISWHVCRLTDKGKNRLEVLSLGYDVTETKSLQNQLLQTQKLEAVGTLAAGIAHDFNNVLWGILGFSEMAIAQLQSEPEKAKKSMEHVLEAGNRAKYMVQQILQFSRQSKIAMGPLDLKSLVKEVTKLLKATVPSNFEIRLKISASVSRVHADATQIHQVLMNLCTNAYHAMQQFNQGVLSLSLDMVVADCEIRCHSKNLPPGRYVCIRISDTGHGIETGNLNKIFDPYFTTKGQGEGTGLGLAVSLGIINSHCGGIQIESRKGEGSVFSIYLPPNEGDFVEVVSYTEKIIGGTERILFVDDESALTEMTESMLTEVGYTVTGFSSSLDALAFFSNHSDQFDLVVTDQTMPGMTGLELAEKIMEIRRLPIILCTGFSENIIRTSMERSGISLILKKPLLRKELSAAIRNVLDEKSEKGNDGQYTDY